MQRRLFLTIIITFLEEIPRGTLSGMSVGIGLGFGKIREKNPRHIWI